MDDSKTDLKNKEAIPVGTDLPANDEPVEDTEVDKEVDTTPEDTDVEETVQISKSELEKLKEERENYKKGMLSAKASSRSLPSSKPQAPAKEEVVDDGWGEESEFVTKKDLNKLTEKGAIKKACLDDPVLNENWDDIVAFYHARNGKSSEEGIIEDLRDATDLWKIRSGYKEKTVDTSVAIKKTTKALTEDKGVNKSKDKTPSTPKKHILKRNEGMDEWF